MSGAKILGGVGNNDWSVGALYAFLPIVTDVSCIPCVDRSHYSAISRDPKPYERSLGQQFFHAAALNTSRNDIFWLVPFGGISRWLCVQRNSQAHVNS